ncbi:MAG: hypothetical protein JWO06_2221 [Bacteroidota bacterium]|nr:hypothetical protein [Bacteroidota bacterium]
MSFPVLRRSILALVFVTSAVACLYAGNSSFRDSIVTKSVVIKPDYYIDEDQRRIDMMDGVFDGRVDLGDSATTAYAQRVYFGEVDSIQQIIDNSGFDEGRKKIFRESLYYQLRRVNRNTVYLVKRYDNVFRFMLGELNAIVQKKLYDYATTNISYTFRTFGLIKNESCADSFLIFAAHYRPEQVFVNYDLYRNRDYALHVLEESAKIAPVTVKRYFNPGDPVYEALKKSEDTVVKTILAIKNKFSRKSNAFTLLDDIMSGKYTMEKADAIGNDPQKFLEAMLKIRAKKNPLGVYSLENDLEIYSLKFIRVLNDLHNEKDAVRFASIEKLPAEDIYTLIVYSEEEIFTSTFNGLFTRMMIKLGPVSGYEFLGELGDNRFRTFVKMCAGFGKLGPFLQSMTAVHQQMLMIKFASGLEKYNDLSQAVEVADAFGSITDSLVLKILKGTIKLEYLKLSAKNAVRGKAIYGLLSSLFVEKSISGGDWFSSVASQYSLPDFDKINNERLFTSDSVDRWLIYFYDDEDGEASFSSFMKTFSDPNWNVIDSGIYIIIQSKTGKHVDIYANKSKNEYDGQAAIEKIFADSSYEPNVMVHRGHSYYAAKTIDKIKDNTQIFVLGSCGGYHSISTILEHSPEISIISSKQIGTRVVNNPMLKLIAEYIRKGKDVEWQSLWKELDVKISAKDDAKAYERFLDYIPPHKNLGAIFIKTYTKMMEQD